MQLYPTGCHEDKIQMHVISLVSIIAFLSAIAASLLRSNPRVVKVTGLIASGLIFLALASTATLSNIEIPSVIAMLIAASAFLCILSQQLVGQAVKAIVMILTIAGFSFSYMNGELPEPMPLIFLGGLFATIVLLLIKDRRDNSLATGTAAVFCVALICLIASFFCKGMLSTIFLLVTAAALLPLFPLQAGFVGSLTCFSGTCAGFLAVVLPCVGWYTIVSRISAIPHPLADIVVILATIGAIFTAIRASVQIDLARSFASIGTVMLSLAWLILGTSDKLATPELASYIMSVAVVTSGLLLCSHHLESRYGTRSRENLRGIAQPMPRLSLLLGLFIIAAAGCPPFAVFSTFMAVILPSDQLHLVLLAPAIFLSCSLLLVSLMQQLLFGKQRSDLIYEDLGDRDVMALLLVASALVAGGALPFLALDQQGSAQKQLQTLAPGMVTTVKVALPVSENSKALKTVAVCRNNI
jgi:hypothetical protein